ncbi:MAG: protein imuA [Alphaproteobacteria bacterium]|nr:protein imuA [Alphaproteobacteria bacterium]
MTQILSFSSPAPGADPRLTDLRAEIGRIERGCAAGIPAVLPTGVAALDGHLPFRGLPLKRLHEVVAAGEREAGAALGFLLALLSRVMRIEAGPVLWCGRRPELHAPALAALGLDPARLILVRARTETDRLWAFEEGLRTKGLAAAVAELEKPLDLAGSRRLQLAAEKGTTGFALRLDGGEAAASAVETRWRIAAAPSVPPADDPDGVGDPRWRVALERCRGGRPGHWLMEKNDATGDLALAPALRDRPDLPAGARVAG